MWRLIAVSPQGYHLVVAGVQCKPNVPFTVKEPETSQRIDIITDVGVNWSYMYLFCIQAILQSTTDVSCTCVCVRVIMLELSQKP